jgi:hypothetical protein
LIKKMATESEAKTNTQSTNQLLKVLIILLVVIVIIIVSIFAISAYWASYQQQQAQNIINGLIPTYAPQTPTPSTWTIYLGAGAYYQTPSIEPIVLTSNSPTDITFSANNILYNGLSANSYGSFAPQLEDASVFRGALGNPISQDTIYSGYNSEIQVYFPEGTGSPWTSGVSVQMSITTSNAQGSTTFTLS